MKGENAMLTSQTSEKTSFMEQWEVYVKPASGKRVWKPLKKKIHKSHKLARVNYWGKGAADHIKRKFHNSPAKSTTRV
jgi:hypothetical protein